MTDEATTPRPRRRTREDGPVDPVDLVDQAADGTSDAMAEQMVPTDLIASAETEADARDRVEGERSPSTRPPRARCTRRRSKWCRGRR